MDTSVEGLPSFETVPGPQPELLPPPPNEQSTETATPAEGNLLARLKSRTQGIFESAGATFKRGGGRPRKDGKPNKLDVPVNVPATALPLGTKADPATGSAAVDAETVKTCLNAVVKAFKGTLDKWLFKKSIKRGDTPKEAQQLIADTTITEEEVESFSKLAEICFRKYGVGTEYCPEIGLGAIVVGVGLRYKLAASGGKKEEGQP